MNDGGPDLHFHSSEGRTIFDSRTWLEEQRRLTTRAPQHVPSGVQICCPPAAAFVGAFLGCLATLHLSALGEQPAIASAMVTFALSAFLLLTGTANLPPGVFFSALYGGSFGGMTPIAALTESVARSGLPVGVSFVLLSIFCGLAFSVASVIDLRMHGLVRDYGGRLGGLAAIASFLFVVLAPLGADGELFRVARIAVFDDDSAAAPLIYATCMAGILATQFALRQPRDAPVRRANRIFIASIVALIGLVLVHHVQPDRACLPDAFYAGCFVGMSSPKLLKGPFQVVVAALALTAVLLLSSTILPAVGGSLGVAAFVTVVGLEVSGRMLGALRRTILEGGRAVLVRSPTLRLARPAKSYGGGFRGGVQPSVPSQLSSRSIPTFAIGVAASLAVAAVLLPSQLPREQPVETTGSIAVGEAPAGPVQAPAGDLEQPLTSPGTLVGAGTAGAPAADVRVQVSTPIAGGPWRNPSSDVQARVSSTARSVIVPRRSARPLAAAQPGPAPAKRRPRQAVLTAAPAAAPLSAPNEVWPVSEPFDRPVLPER